jgi:flagellar motor switch protein FliM
LPPTTAPHAATAAAWRHRLERLLQATPLHLEAELLRVERPLGDVQRLAVGDVLPFARGDLQAVALVDGHGRRVLTGRLGQIGGKRALRLEGPTRPAATAAPPRETLAEPPPDPPAEQPPDPPYEGPPEPMPEASAPD